MNLAPLVRIGLRYGVGLVLGMEAGEMLAADPDMVIIGTLALGALVELLYVRAKRKGGAT